MPVTFDFNQSELFGPIYRKGLEDGREEGREERRKQGYREVLIPQLRARFGELPSWVHDRLQAASAPELEGLRLVEVEGLKKNARRRSFTQ